MPEYLTVREVAAIYRVNEITVRRHIRSGKLSAVKIGGRVRVRREDAEGLELPVQANTREVASEPAPTAAEIARRKLVIARMDDMRSTMEPLDISTVELLRLARQENEGHHNA